MTSVEEPKVNLNMDANGHQNPPSTDASQMVSVDK